MTDVVAQVSRPRRSRAKVPPDSTVCADGGFATVWAAGVISALATLLSLVLVLATVVVARHRAASAADLAALAGAVHALDGEPLACERARWVADRMSAELVACDVRGWEVTVRVAVAPPGAASVFGPAMGAARAGPVGNGQTVDLGR
ncbi:Rv3654c family TadE-like protein [Actinokineospora sp. HUAS TT18]|uniref:Rv3654c family TadE-like protein n=1 Tax=Actinokineospora sp. HUAS TT18 TaxID=3447451 RepID=UPI003F522968